MPQQAYLFRFGFLVAILHEKPGLLYGVVAGSRTREGPLRDTGGEFLANRFRLIASVTGSAAMGIDFHGLNFLAYAAKKQPFGATATIGRQNINLSNYAIWQILKLHDRKRYGPFCEDLLVDHLKASSVDSFDNSGYEDASFVHDFNQPIDPGRQYDTVIDFGTLEHIFNIPVALKNVAALCKQGGQILHALPANNLCGHGFWQFSPELFFSLYSASNGFSETEVFITEIDNERSWYRAAVPSGGTRVDFTSKSCSYVLVRTRKVAVTTGDAVQQSDYVYKWEGSDVAAEPASGGGGRWLRSVIERVPVVSALAWAALKYARDRKDPNFNARLGRLSAGNKHFTEIPIVRLTTGNS